MSLLQAFERTQDHAQFSTSRPPSDATARICRQLEMATAAAFGVPVAELRAPTRRSAEAALARQSAMYLVHVTLGLTYSVVGTLFHRDRTTASYACKLIEDRRDDPVIDDLLQMLEYICGQIACGIVACPQVRP